MKACKYVIVFALTGLSFSGFALEKKPDLRIDAFPNNQGAVTLQDKPYFQKTFNVNVHNNEKRSVSLTNGCFVLFNGEGKKVESSGVSFDLLGEYGGLASKNGEVFFMGKTKEFFEYPFIKWSTTECNK